jgi:hypothetical protein
MADKFLGFLEATGKDIVHVVEEAPKVASALGSLLRDGVSLGPEVKTAIQDVMSAAEAVAVSGGPAVLAEAKSITLDAATFAAVQNLIKVFLAEYPVIAKAISTAAFEVEATIKAAN